MFKSSKILDYLELGQKGSILSSLLKKDLSKSAQIKLTSWDRYFSYSTLKPKKARLCHWLLVRLLGMFTLRNSVMFIPADLLNLSSIFSASARLKI
ncbi:hypothetical protein NIES4106_17690 [Fischerella sp. NIES-4106]|jgi:hypothetical protein|nr:hypothetical protein NIES4106_17690 [Fischerella sp. NIES-4106]